MYLAIVLFYVIIFFFQAEDGIRDTSVTGVQTCALPISEAIHRLMSLIFPAGTYGGTVSSSRSSGTCDSIGACCRQSLRLRSEERRVGKECRSRGGPEQCRR